MKFMTKNKGAISIFLALILLPMMAVASVYIEASRIKAAKAVASAAGDLTLNTALTNYDYVLKDMYGLMATSQTEDELMKNLSDYYYNSMISAGLDSASANTYVEQIMAAIEQEIEDMGGSEATTDDNVVDMLSLNFVGAGFKDTTDDTTSLANPVYLKSQIIDLMKYRTPLDAGLSFLASLESFTTLGEQQTVIDKKNEYYEEQQNVVKLMQVATSYLRKYNKLATESVEFEGAEADVEQCVQLVDGSWEPFYVQVAGYLGKYTSPNNTADSRLWYISNNLYTQQYNAQKELTSGQNKYFNVSFKYYAYKTTYNTKIMVDGTAVQDIDCGEYSKNKNGNKITKYPSLEDIYAKAGVLGDNYVKYTNIIKADTKKLFDASSSDKNEIQWLIQYNRAIENANSNYPKALYDCFVAHYDIINSINWVINAEKFYTDRANTMEGWGIKGSLDYPYDFDFAANTINKIIQLNKTYGLIDEVKDLVDTTGNTLSKTKENAQYLGNQFNQVMNDVSNADVTTNGLLTSYNSVVGFIYQVEECITSTENSVKELGKQACDNLIDALNATKDLSVYIKGYHGTKTGVTDINKLLEGYPALNKYSDYKYSNAPVLKDISDNPVASEVNIAIGNINNIKALIGGETRDKTLSEYCTMVRDSLKKIYVTESTSIIGMFKRQNEQKKNFIKEIDELIKGDRATAEAIYEELQKPINVYGDTTTITVREVPGKYSDKLTTALSNFANLTCISSTDHEKGVFKKIYEKSTKDEIKTSALEKNIDLVQGVKSDEYAKDLYDNINVWHTKLTKAKGHLTSASGKLGEVADKLAEGGALDEKEDAWKAATENGNIKGTTIAQQNQQEISAVKDTFSYDEVVELKAVVDKKIATIEKALTELSEYKYAGTSLMQMKNHTDYDKALNTLTGYELINVPLNTTELNETSKKVYASAFTNGGFTSSWSDADASPQFDETKVCRFYQYLMNNFPDILEGDTSNLDEERKDEDGELKKSEDQLNDKKKEYDGKVKENTPNADTSMDIAVGSKDWPSLGWGELKEAADSLSQSSSGEEITGFFDALSQALKNATEDLRDYILMSDFIMRNFTYNSYENEIRYKISAEGSRESLSDVIKMLAKPVYNNGAYEPNEEAFNLITKDPNRKGTAKEEYMKEAVNIMGQRICPAYNSDYLGEVEYIVFGKYAGTKAFATTYGIRVAFNTIYAFTDSTIREGAFSIASAIFGCPPLTFLIPVAQIAIIIGVALAESAIDMAMLKAGMPVPIYKDSNSWVLSFKSLLQNVGKEIEDAAKDALASAANKVVDGAVSKLNEYLEMTDAELNKLIESGDEKLTEMLGSVSDGIEKEINEYADTAINQLTTLCQNARSMIYKVGDSERIHYNGEDMEPSAYVNLKLEEWLAQQETTENSIDLNNIGHIAKKAAVQVIIDGDYAAIVLGELDNIYEQSKGVEQMAGTKVQELAQKMNDQLALIKGEIESKVHTASAEITKYKDEAKQKLETAINDGAQSVKNAIADSIQGITLGGEGSGGLTLNNNNASMGEFFNFQYSDYLRVYLLISLLTDEEGVMLRTGDVIQANMRLASGNSTYMLKNAHTHVSFDVELEVKPLFIGIPESVLGKKVSSSWNKFTYSAKGGY